MYAYQFQERLQQFASDADGVFLQRFFKTGPGQYGEGDIFIGVKVPITRKICKEFSEMPPSEIQILFDSPIHEHRLAAVVLCTMQYKKAQSTADKQAIFDFYLKNVYAGRVNNWDLVDVSCAHIIGQHLIDKQRDMLFELTKSDVLWQKRVAIISTFAFLRVGDPTTTLELAELLWPDKHDLMQKATGWMLREMGKKVDETLLTDFLDIHAHELPRTCLRYAIEKLPESRRQYYMKLAKQQ